MASDASLVAFPASEPTGEARPIPVARPPHLPFRRISLPTAPTVLRRQSVLSIASFDSGLGDAELSPQRAARPRRPRPPSMGSPVRKQRRRDGSARPLENTSRLAKARKIIDEFYETEKAYVKGLDLIYSHFLVPIIESLDTSDPLLDRTTLNSIFSNFIDIWNLHRSFLSALDAQLEKSKDGPLPPLSSLLLSHFPYLSLYNPFITNFPSIISSLTELTTMPTATRPNPRYNPVFADFVRRQESDPRCGKLKLRDWLLTVVQRCPRYLLLLKDLIAATGSDDPEHTQLVVAHGLVSKITVGLNTSLHTHAQTLALLALQRATSNLPFQLLSPGRTLIKRGSLLHVERNDPPKPREFLLFSDCLVWLASVDPWDWDSLSAWSGSGSTGGGNTSNAGTPTQAQTPAPSTSAPPSRPAPLLRNRSRSEAELPRVGIGRSRSGDPGTSAAPSTPGTPSTPSTPSRYGNANRRSYHPQSQSPLPPPPVMATKRRGNSSTDERWVFKGKVDLVDVEVTVGSVLGEEYRFEILNPEESFVVYAASEQSRDEWVTAIRHAKSELLESLNATNPNSTLTSSSSTNHIRRSLQALPFHPSDDRLATLKGNSSLSPPTSPTKRGKEKEKKQPTERRRKVEHWVPPVWIPDGKTNECMRCGRLFGWRRRRHHCRLCGRCVCNACSGRTFYIADASGKDESTKPARACDACYETVFPIIDDDNSFAGTGQKAVDEDTITSLSGLPSWLSMPSMPSKPTQPQALMAMAIDAKYGPPDTSLDLERPRSFEEKEPPRVIHLRPHHKLRSYHEILEDFEAHDRGEGFEGEEVHDDVFTDTGVGSGNEWTSETEDEDREQLLLEARLSRLLFTPPSSSFTHHHQQASPQTSPSKRKEEDTVRRRKRFSMPAVALQTTQVTARASLVFEDGGGGGGGGGEDSSNNNQESTPTRQRRFSLVLSPSRSSQVRNSVAEPVREEDEGDANAKSLAANKLSQLLNRPIREQ